MPVTVLAYVTSWCPDCHRSHRVLQRAGVEFIEVDIETVAGSEDIMRSLNGGSGKVPTILIDSPGGRRILIEPSDRELADALRSAKQHALEESPEN